MSEVLDRLDRIDLLDVRDAMFSWDDPAYGKRWGSTVSDYWTLGEVRADADDGPDQVVIFFDAREVGPGSGPGVPSILGWATEYEFEVVGFAFDTRRTKYKPAPLTREEKADLMRQFEAQHDDLVDNIA